MGLSLKNPVHVFTQPIYRYLLYHRPCLRFRGLKCESDAVPRPSGGSLFSVTLFKGCLYSTCLWHTALLPTLLGFFWAFEIWYLDFISRQMSFLTFIYLILLLVWAYTVPLIKGFICKFDILRKWGPRLKTWISLCTCTPEWQFGNFLSSRLVICM